MDDLHRIEEQQRRLLTLGHLAAGRLTLGEAAQRLKVGERQAYRLLAEFRSHGPAAAVHGNQGKRPANALAPEIVERIVNLAATKYKGFNHQHLTEMLEAEEGIVVGRRTVSRYLTANNHRSPRTHRTQLHRRRRERRSREGLLLQADGSEHSWLGDRGPKFTLLAAIDDATSKAWASFWHTEDAEGYFRLKRTIVTGHGIPHAWYCDRDSVFTVNRRRGAVLDDAFFEGPQNTQFGRLLGELGVELILANSPQGKGRIERFFDTAQDRLVSLLRLHDVRTMHDANLVLPIFLNQFHKLFGVAPREPDPAWLPWPDHLGIDDTFCFKYRRRLARDHTISLHGMTYTVPPAATRRPGTELLVHQWFDRTVRIFHGAELLANCPPEPAPRRSSIPSRTHPWRRFQLLGPPPPQ